MAQVENDSSANPKEWLELVDVLATAEAVRQAGYESAAQVIEAQYMLIQELEVKQG